MPASVHAVDSEGMDELTDSVRALYDKISQVEPRMSRALVQRTVKGQAL